MSFRGLPFVELQIGKLRQTTPTLWWKTPYTRILGGLMGRTCTRVHFEHNGGKSTPYMQFLRKAQRVNSSSRAVAGAGTGDPGDKIFPFLPGETRHVFALREIICKHPNKLH